MASPASSMFPRCRPRPGRTPPGPRLDATMRRSAKDRMMPRGYGARLSLGVPPPALGAKKGGRPKPTALPCRLTPRSGVDVFAAPDALLAPAVGIGVARDFRVRDPRDDRL